MRGIKLIKTGLASLLIVAGSFVAVATIDPFSIAQAARCSSNDVIDCGVKNISDLRNAYNTDRTKGTKNIFTYAKITSDTVNKATVKNGTLYRDGRVVVDGKTVATGAHTIGRNYSAGSKKHTYNGTTFYSGPANVRLVSDARPLLVFFDKNGQFSGAVMKECGNPVIYTKTVPNPVAECTSLTASRIGARSFKLDARAKAANGATISSYTYTITPAGGGSALYTRTVNTSGQSSSIQTGEQTALKYGTSYLARVTVKTSIGNKTSSACTATIKTEAEKTVEVCDPATGKTKTVKESERDKYLPKDAKECQPPVYIEVCVLKDKKYPVRIKEDDFDSKLHSKDPKDCEEPELVKVCDLNDKTVKHVTKEAYEADKERYTTDLAKCETKYIDVCRLEDKKYPVRIKEEDFDRTLHSRDAADCKEAPKPEGEVEVCDPATGKIKTVKESERSKYLDRDSDACKEKVAVKETVTELPQTGVAEAFSGVLGIGALTTASYYYLASRRNG